MSISNCTKYSFLKCEYFYKNSQRYISLTVIGNQKCGRGQNSAASSPMTIVIDSKNVLRFPHFPGRMKNKNFYGSLRLLNILKRALQIMIWILGLDRKFTKRQGFAAQLNLPFPGGNGLHGKKVKTSNFSGTIQLIFFILSPCVCENNGLLNKNCWDDLDIIYLGYPWTNYNKISTTWPATKNVVSSDLENAGQCRHLQKSVYLSCCTNDFYQIFV